MRKSFIITAVLIAAALGTLLLLAFNQFQLYGSHEKIISQTEKILFQYSNIREQIVEDVIEDRTGELSRVSPAVEELNNNLIKILDNKLIPAEYKISFLQQIDLPGLVLLLRKTSAEERNANLLSRINEESRVIGERFMLFERLVLGHAKQKLVDFQSIVIGILALVVFLVTALMIVTYRFLIAPVMSISTQSQSIISGHQDKIYDPGGWQEVAGLAEKLNRQSDEFNTCQRMTERYERISTCIRKVVQKVLPAPDRDVLYQSVCRSVLSNSDYALAWIGGEDHAEGEFLPIVADGSSSMSCEECQECFSALLAAQEGEEPAYQAYVNGEPVVMTDVLQDAPKGPFKKTPMVDGRVDSLSVPMVFEGKKYGVLTVYAMLSEGFLDVEVELLSQIAALIAEKVFSLDTLRAMDIFAMEKKIIGEHAEVVALAIDKKGIIHTAEAYPEGSHNEETVSVWIGSSILDIVIPENDLERLVFKDSIKDGTRYAFKAKLVGSDEQFTAVMEPLKEFPGEQERLLLMLVAPQKNLLLHPENFKIAYSAAIGQFAGSIAHDITDMSNGMINYAQMMSDEFGESELEKRKSLNKIIEGGEKVASRVEPLLIDPNDLEFTQNMEKIDKIFKDVLLLIDPQFKRDCVKINMSIQPTSLTFKNQHVQLILLDLFKRLEEIINKVYPQKDAGKILDIAVSPLYEDGKKMLLVNFQFPMGNGDFTKKTFQQGSFGRMWLSQELARALGGEVTFSETDAGKGQVGLLLPA